MANRAAVSDVRRRARWQPQLVERALVFAPVGADLDAQIEEHPRVEEAFELDSGAPDADGLDHRAAPADDDRLLRFALDQDGAVQAEQPLRVRLFEPIDDDRGRERQLRVRVPQHLLAHQLGHEEPLGLIGQVVVGIERLAFGKMRQQHRLEALDVVARQRRDRHDVGEPDRRGRSAR